MRALFLATLPALLLCHMPSASAETFKAHDLYEKCSDDRQTADFNFCIGFVRGVVGMGAFVHALGDEVQNPALGAVFVICPKGPISNAQMIQSFKNYHDKHSEDWNDDAEQIVLLPIQATLPCKKS